MPLRRRYTDIVRQVLCLLLTLLITPVVYSYFDGLRAWRPSDMFNPLVKLFRPKAAPVGAPGFPATPEKIEP